MSGELETVKRELQQLQDGGKVRHYLQKFINFVTYAWFAFISKCAFNIFDLTTCKASKQTESTILWLFSKATMGYLVSERKEDDTALLSASTIECLFKVMGLQSTTGFLLATLGMVFVAFAQIVMLVSKRMIKNSDRARALQQRILELSNEMQMLAIEEPPTNRNTMAETLNELRQTREDLNRMRNEFQHIQTRTEPSPSPSQPRQRRNFNAIVAEAERIHLRPSEISNTSPSGLHVVD